MLAGNGLFYTEISNLPMVYKSQRMGLGFESNLLPGRHHINSTGFYLHKDMRLWSCEVPVLNISWISGGHKRIHSTGEWGAKHENIVITQELTILRKSRTKFSWTTKADIYSLGSKLTTL